MITDGVYGKWYQELAAAGVSVAHDVDRAMVAAALVSGIASWEPFAGMGGDGVLCVAGFRYATRLDELGVPVLSDSSRADLVRNCNRQRVGFNGRGEPFKPAG